MLEEEIKKIKEEILKEVKASIMKDIKESLKEVIRETISERKVYDVRVDLTSEDIEEMSPFSLLARDIASVIRESIKKGLRERGEEAIEELIKKLPEDKATHIIKSLANEDRIKILKLLYNEMKSFSQLKEELKLESSSLSHNLKQLLSAGLISYSGTYGKYRISSRGKLLLRLLALIYEGLGGEIYEY